jgi:hypothetical protein
VFSVTVVEGETESTRVRRRIVHRSLKLTSSVLVVGLAGSVVVGDVLEDGSEADGVVDIGLLLGVEAHALGVASSLDVKDSSVGPDVLVVTNEAASGVGGKGGLAGSRKSEEERDVAVGSLVGRRVKREVSELDGLEVVLW